MWQDFLQGAEVNLQENGVLAFAEQKHRLLKKAVSEHFC
jgi:uncharacterized membrane protein YobD (UPF0266 family)